MNPVSLRMLLATFFFNISSCFVSIISTLCFPACLFWSLLFLADIFLRFLAIFGFLLIAESGEQGIRWGTGTGWDLLTELPQRATWQAPFVRNPWSEGSRLGCQQFGAEKGESWASRHAARMTTERPAFRPAPSRTPVSGAEGSLARTLQTSGF